MKKSLAGINSLSVKALGGVGNPINRSFPGSMSLVTLERTSCMLFRILIDCGMSDFGDKVSFVDKISPSQIDLIILTHAHLDHVGSLPYFLDKNSGFNGRIIATNETLKLSEIMINDLLKFKHNQIEFSSNIESIQTQPSYEQYLKVEKYLLSSTMAIPSISKWKFKILKAERRALKQLLESSYLLEDITQSSQDYVLSNGDRIGGENQNFQLFNRSKVYTMDYGESFDFHEGVSIVLENSAHILGSSQVLIKVDDGYGGTINLGFSGDVGRFYGNNLSYPHVFNDKLDFYMIESTYGSRLHSKQQNDLILFIDDVAAHGGKIFIPTFMLQRFQDVALEIINLQNKYQKSLEFDRFSQLPIYVDSPQIPLINEIFANSKYYNIYKNLLDNKKLKYINYNGSNETFNGNFGPGIIFTTGGMIQGGSIQKYLKLLKRKHNGLVFSGFQGESTPGRQILDGTDFENGSLGGISNYGCRVFDGSFFSNHGDQSDLLNLLSNTKYSSNCTIMTNHGVRFESQLELLGKAAENKVVPSNASLVQSWINREIKII